MTRRRVDFRHAVVVAAGLCLLACGSAPGAPLADRIPPSPPPTGLYQDVARTSRDGAPLGPADVAAVSEVRSLALAGDVDALVRLCGDCRDPGVAQQTRTVLAGDGTRQLARILLTHAETTDGLTYPGLVFEGSRTDLDRLDAEFLGLSADERYTGLTTSFGAATAWSGISVAP